ncbi:3-hydroxyacyl-CoA dehydrogenase family protein [Haloarcula argentinensis]|uniref:3-hydroxyacyl-CoA dehydrogenase family protein n=1 Tax=Haloarcula argentinensis TaxID=43776 RepID=A0ABU2F508_HALAR|nr:3-hydroxyacyl-CoA dehydrogenase family protein [Haloarcula argentinensis]EMA17880.1 3-hydroxyacyl-CoA dehydrogenase [Haloarcula argentinensis DSM 12282]MDS0255665.1 3-hydroxyacyl-CoA dehydrogenase family protein [Haloarcula argentinensis]
MHVAILGAGTMGHGIAQVSAMAGHDVSLRDIEADIVDDGLAAIESNLEEGIAREKVTESTAKATLDRLTGTTSLEAAVTGADLVVEAVPEDMAIKHETLTEVESHVDPATLIASNTSSLSLTEIASVLDYPERAIGLHFFNPVHIMALVEIVVAEQTSAETVSRAREFVNGIDKTPIEVADAPGFASSRLGVSLGVEAMRMVQEGVATPQDIDTAMELGYNHPMGPIELGDVVGLDVRLDILEYLRAELGERFRPPQILKRKVRAGKLGKKSGEGFYVWEDGDIVGTSGDWGNA